MESSQISAQFPPHFFGDTTSFEAATKLQLPYGEDVSAALHFHSVPYFPIVVSVQNQM